MDRFKIYGPPGTGKTTHLLGLLKKELKTVHPQDIAYVSFTRKGTYEGVERAQEKFKLDRKDLKYFKTIHALCFAEIGAKKAGMLDFHHFKMFSEALGIKFLGYYTEDLASNNDQYLFAEYLERNNIEMYQSFINDLNEKKLNWVKINYRQFKRQLELRDYTDLLEEYLKNGKPLPIKVAFIDEAQDLTSLQWLVVDKLFAEAERIYIAGDDDQAIYEWSGADVNRFLNLQANEKVLAKSYRLPKRIYKFAYGIVKEIRNRKDKKFIHNGFDGQLRFTTSWTDADINLKEHTLVLSRNNTYLKKMGSVLKKEGKLFHYKGEMVFMPRIMDAIKKYTDWTQGKLKDSEIILYNHLFKKLDKGTPWFMALNMEAEDIEYYRNIIAQKTNLDRCPIDLETIHSAKGSEADHVVLMLDMTARVYRNLQTRPDQELRCLYVGATRAKKRLTILLSQSQHSYPSFQDFDKGDRREN